jgi:membrane fusion protein (multidrug efflux system)
MSQTILKETEKLPQRPETEKGRKRNLKWVFLVGLIVFVALAAIGILMRGANTRTLQQRSNEASQSTVTVVQPEKAPVTIPLQLPGETRAYTDAPIFAQTSGYLKKWNFDIGARVKAGDILAEIDTPEVDQQLNQSKAQLGQSRAALNLSEATYKRNQDLFNRKVVSAQDFDNSSGDYRVKQATVVADQANVDRLTALEAFKLVRAPFNGVVTQRNTDIGAYIAAGSGTQLFRMAQTSPLRVYINVPQTFAQFVKTGTKGELTVNEIPGRKFPAQVVGTAQAIDPASRTLLTQLEVPNENGELFPGAYAQIILSLTGDTGTVTVPSNALLFRSEGASVGVARPDGTVEIRKITISRDLGDKLEVSQGLSYTDQVIINPADGLADGTKVTVNKQSQQQAQQQVTPRNQ